MNKIRFDVLRASLDSGDAPLWEIFAFDKKM
jgi:hypothetical protein